MAIFHCYVSSPERTGMIPQCGPKIGDPNFYRSITNWAYEIRGKRLVKKPRHPNETPNRLQEGLQGAV